MRQDMSSEGVLIAGDLTWLHAQHRLIKIVVDENG